MVWKTTLALLFSFFSIYSLNAQTFYPDFSQSKLQSYNGTETGIVGTTYIYKNVATSLYGRQIDAKVKLVSNHNAKVNNIDNPTNGTNGGLDSRFQPVVSITSNGGYAEWNIDFIYHDDGTQITGVDGFGLDALDIDGNEYLQITSPYTNPYHGSLVTVSGTIKFQGGPGSDNVIDPTHTQYGAGVKIVNQSSITFRTGNSGKANDRQFSLSFQGEVCFSGAISPPNVTGGSYCLGDEISAQGSGIIKWYSNSSLTNLFHVGPSWTPTTVGTKTVYVTREVASCISATTPVTITINAKPKADAPANVKICDAFTLPELENGSYFAKTGGIEPIAVGSEITSTTTIFVYTAANGACTFAENSFKVTITKSPIITNPGNQERCDSYTLPAISGTNLSGNQAYYNNSQANGGTIISGPITSSQKVWIYDANGSCKDEKSFDVTITKSPIITNPGDQATCDSYTLPAISGTNLSGNQAYYNNSQANGGTAISGSNNKFSKDMDL